MAKTSIDNKSMKKVPDIKLSGYTNDENIVCQPFVYSEANAIAELIGWQIVLVFVVCPKNALP